MEMKNLLWERRSEKTSLGGPREACPAGALFSQQRKVEPQPETGTAALTQWSWCEGAESSRRLWFLNISHSEALLEPRHRDRDPERRENRQKSEMLAVLDQAEAASGLRIDNTDKFLQLMLFKLLLDAAAFYLCSQKSYAYVFTACSLSIVVADVVLTCALAGIWLVGAQGAPVALCLLLAKASAAYGALPLPMMLLGLLDYCLHDSYLCTSCRYLRNAVLVSLGWLLALIHAHISVRAEARELSWALVCEVGESVPVSLFGLTVLAALLCVMLRFLPRVPRWLREADRLSQVREEQKSHSSDLFIATGGEKQGQQDVGTRSWERPPLWASLALGFGTFWTPYLTLSAVCLLLDLGVPAYVTVNVLWLECANSFLMGLVFWTRSSREGPYSQLPDNVCLWNLYWHLSNGTRDQGLPIAVFNPSKVKRSSLFLV